MYGCDLRTTTHRLLPRTMPSCTPRPAHTRLCNLPVGSTILYRLRTPTTVKFFTTTLVRFDPAGFATFRTAVPPLRFPVVPVPEERKETLHWVNTPVLPLPHTCRSFPLCRLLLCAVRTYFTTPPRTACHIPYLHHACLQTVLHHHCRCIPALPFGFCCLFTCSAVDRLHRPPPPHLFCLHRVQVSHAFFATSMPRDFMRHAACRFLLRAVRTGYGSRRARRAAHLRFGSPFTAASSYSVAHTCGSVRYATVHCSAARTRYLPVALTYVHIFMTPRIITHCGSVLHSGARRRFTVLF